MNHYRCCLALLAAVVCATPAAAQRRLRFGPLVSTISIENGNAVAASYGGYGATLALLTGDYDESGLVVFRYNDLSDNSCTRQVTFFGLNSSYYPIGARGIAPFASTELGLARVTEAQAPLLFSCTASTPVQTSNQLGIAFGLGVRVGTRDAAATLEARFLQVPNSFVQGLEILGDVSVAL